MDCSFQPPAPFREQRAYREELSASWNPHFSRMAGNWFGESTWGNFQQILTFSEVV